MTHRRQLGPVAPRADVDGLLYLLRDNLRRADAFITTAEEQIERSWGGGEDQGGDDSGGDGVLRRRNQAAKLAVQAGNYTGEEIAAEIATRRWGA